MSLTRSQINWSELSYKFLFYATYLMMVAMIVIPIVFTISASFRPLSEIWTTELYLIPRQPTIEPWFEGFEDLRGALLNSFIIASGTVIIACAVAIPGAYAFSRTEFPHQKLLFYLVVLSLLFPHVLLVIPIVDIWYDIGLYNSYLGVWLAQQTFVIPFSIWILRDFFQKMPSNIEEVAMVYGCTQWKAFIRVVLPLAKPAIVAVLFLSFLNGWNDFIFSNMITDSQGPRPAVPQLYATVSSGETTNWQLLMSESLIVGIPPVVLYLFARSYISEAFAVSST